MLPGPSEDVCIHVRTWVGGAWAGGEVVQLAGEPLAGNAQRAGGRDGITSVFGVECYEVPFECFEQLRGEGVQETDMHDGEHRVEELGWYKHPGDFLHHDAVKGLGHNEAAVQVADLEEAVEPCLVLGLRVGNLSLSLAFSEPGAETAL